MSEMILNLKNEITKFYRNMSKVDRNESYFGHWYDHISRVVENVREIADELDCEFEYELVIAAAYCHDIAYGIDPINHSKLSSEMCVEYLQRSGFQDDQIGKIKNIILAHSRKSKSPVTIEDKVMYLADKLDMIGIDGIIRMFMEYSRNEGCCDYIAQMVEIKVSKYVDYILSFGFCKKLIEARWRDSKSIIFSVLNRKYYKF